MKNIVLFCQAPIDVSYCLMIYEKNKDLSDISIIVVNVEPIYQFLLSLGLRLKLLIFIPYTSLSLKRPLSILEEKLRLRNTYNKYFKQLRNCEIYFFYRVYDWVTFYFIARLSKNNIILYAAMDELAVEINNIKIKMNIKESINLNVLKFITGINLKYVNHPYGLIVLFDYEKKYIIKKIKLPDINMGSLDKYKVQLDNVGPKSILFFENSQINYNIFTNYDSKVLEIIDAFSNKGYSIYIKPHPRQGYSSYLTDKATVLPRHIPSELMSIEKFKYIIGIETTALSNIISTNSTLLCLIDMFEFVDNNQKEYIKKHITEKSVSKIIFIQSIKELNSYIT